MRRIERRRSGRRGRLSQPAEVLAALIKNETVEYAKLVKQIGLKPQ